MEKDEKQQATCGSNPWKGLNFYLEGETLYGRSEEIGSLSQYIINNTQTILYGRSGIGKSSIIYAGVFPIARRAGLYPVPIRMEHGGNMSYMSQIKRAFAESGIGINEVVPVIDENGETLWEYMHRHTFHFPGKPEVAVRPLIVFDQFEEIFTLQRNEEAKVKFFSQLADLINEVVPQYVVDAQDRAAAEPASSPSAEFSLDLGNEDTTEYVHRSNFSLVFVIREDFLSYLERYTAYIPAMKSNRYGLRTINEEQAGEIIMKPCPGLIDRAAAKLIISKVAGCRETDFELDGVPELEIDSAVLSLFLSRLYLKKNPADRHITIDLINRHSEDIIKDFYVEATSRIDEQKVYYLEDNLVNKEGRRENISRYNAMNVGHLTANDLKILVDEEKLIRQFSYNNSIRLEFIHDILCPIVKERKEQREQLRRQAEEQQRQAEEQRRQAEELAAADRKVRQNMRRLYYTIATVAAGLLVWLVVAMANSWSWSEDYGNFTTVNGWPVGLGETLDDAAEKEQLVVYYRLTRQGWLPPEWGGRPFTLVEVMSPAGNKCINPYISSPAVGLLDTELDDYKAQEFARLQRSTSHWVYVPVADRDFSAVNRCVAYGIDNKELYSIHYYKDMTYAAVDDNSDRYVQWALFYDAGGKLMRVTDNGIDRMRQTVSRGMVTGCLFFSELGAPQRNTRGCYGYSYENNDTTHLVTRQYRVDKFGSPLPATAIDFLKYEYGRCVESSLGKMFRPQPDMEVHKYAAGYSDTLRINAHGSICYGSFHPDAYTGVQKVVFSYDNNGNRLLEQRFADDTLAYGCQYAYDGSGRLASTKVFDGIYRYDEKYEYPEGGGTVVTLWQNDKKFDAIGFHKYVHTTVTDSIYVVETEEYRNSDGNLATDSIYFKTVQVRERSTGNVKMNYVCNSHGDIYRSEWLEYDEYGNKVARAVAGIDGTPVRCPHWDKYELCYYKMIFLRDFWDEDFVAVKGANEFGDQSYIMSMGDYIFHLTDLPFGRMEKQVSGINYMMGFSIAERSIARSNIKECVPYLHLLNKRGTMYAAAFESGDKEVTKKRLLDGDILVAVGNWQLGKDMNNTAALGEEWKRVCARGGKISVLRVCGNRYVAATFNVAKGAPGAEYHVMPLTTHEKNELKKYMQ